MELLPNKDPIKGELLSLDSVVRKSGVSLTTVKRMINLSYVESFKKGGRNYVYYRDFLRGAWQYECDKKTAGRKDAS